MKRNIYYLISILAIVLLSFGARAQGGLDPLVNSTHTYTITPGSGSNTMAWSVSPATGFSIISGAASASVEIKWTVAGTYTLTFTETNTSTSCSTVKTATVVVSANTFDVSTSSPTATCNSADGLPNYSGSTATTSITFTVDMTTEDIAWSPDWEFTFTLTPNSGVTITNVVASEGTLTTGPYKLTDISSTSGANSVTLTMDVTGNIYTLNTVALAITSASELQYDTPDKDSDDLTGTQTINAVPNTSTISAN